MKDLSYNVNLMDIELLAGDFTINEQASQQTGGLLLYTKNLNLEFPLFGVGMGDVVNANVQTQQSYLNRWQSQVLQDGAVEAIWRMAEVDNNLVFTTFCEY